MKSGWPRITGFQWLRGRHAWLEQPGEGPQVRRGLSLLCGPCRVQAPPALPCPIPCHTWVQKGRWGPRAQLWSWELGLEVEWPWTQQLCDEALLPRHLCAEARGPQPLRPLPAPHALLGLPLFRSSASSFPLCGQWLWSSGLG